MPGTPLEQLLCSVDPEACRLVGLPGRIWVLGGPCSPTEAAPASLRDSFWRQTFALPPKFPWLKELNRPEDYDHWWAFSGYDDLLEFERDACYLARAIVLFAESPGSLAELGALALDESILSRLMVVVQDQYLNEGARASFLYLGPLNRVNKSGCRCVIGTNKTTVLTQDDLDIVIDSINGWIPVVPQSTALRVDNSTHRLLLLADLVDLLTVSKLEDLIEATAHFSVNFDKSSVLRAATLLDFFGLVSLKYRGSEPFLVRNIKSAAPWVDYTANVGNKFDRLRFKTNTTKWIQNNDRRRASVLERSQ